MTQRNEEIEQHRKGAVKCQQKQAKKMLEKAQNKLLFNLFLGFWIDLFRFGPVNIGTTVRLPIDAVDRPKTGHLSLLGVVMSTDDGFYQIGTKNGVLQQK